MNTRSYGLTTAVGQARLVAIFGQVYTRYIMVIYKQDNVCSYVQLTLAPRTRSTKQDQLNWQTFTFFILSFFFLFLIFRSFCLSFFLFFLIFPPSIISSLFLSLSLSFFLSFSLSFFLSSFLSLFLSFFLSFFTVCFVCLTLVMCVSLPSLCYSVILQFIPTLAIFLSFCIFLFSPKRMLYIIQTQNFPFTYK